MIGRRIPAKSTDPVRTDTQLSMMQPSLMRMIRWTAEATSGLWVMMISVKP